MNSIERFGLAATPFLHHAHSDSTQAPQIDSRRAESHNLGMRHSAAGGAIRVAAGIEGK